jgi:AraC-like DNA-binding protein
MSLTIDLHCNSTANFADIALSLGFAEHRAFHRVLRKWTGLAPYRRGLSDN